MSNPVNWDRVERLLGKGTLARLGGQKVAVVGLGSGGGFVAVSLAMSGVGRFVLIDDDVIEATNVVRHVADLEHLGQPKVEAVASLIRGRNPRAEIEVIRGRIQDHQSQLDDADLVVVGVDGEQSKYVINGVCRAMGKTAIYAGVYERGEGGDVVVIYPNNAPDGVGPCYACWAEQLREDAPTQDAGVQLDYGMVGADGTLEAEPALWLHVVRVASVQSELALNELFAGTPNQRTYPANTVVLANVEMEIFEGVKAEPFTAQWVDIQRDPGCLVCGEQQRTESLSLDALLADDATDSLSASDSDSNLSKSADAL